MLHEVFGDIEFNVGWKSKKNVELFGKVYLITLKIQAYYEEEGITAEQEQAYLDYSKAEADKTKRIEELLTAYDSDAQMRFVPKMLLFNKDGSYALLCDDQDVLDEGIAVCLSPEEKVVLQDDYL